MKTPVSILVSSLNKLHDNKVVTDDEYRQIMGRITEYALEDGDYRG